MNKLFGPKILLFSLLLFYINCCSPGYYLSSDKCIACQSGYFSKGSNSKCEECPEGTYSRKGSSQCIPCPSGTFSKSKSKKCSNCPKGTFSEKGNSVCTPCPEKYFSNKEGSAYCRKCPDNTYSYIGSSSCFECPEGEKSCPDASTKKSKIKRKNSEKDDKLEKFGKLMTKDIFGKDVEFTNYELTFYVGDFMITITLFSDASFDLVQDVHFVITNRGFSAPQYNNYEVFKNASDIVYSLIDAIKEGFPIISIDYLEQKLGDDIVNGEISVKYYLLLNAIEITIASKITDELGNEFEAGVKYKIIPLKKPPPPPEPETVGETNENENYVWQPFKKSYEYIYTFIESLKSPNTFVVVWTVVAVGILLAFIFSGGSVPAFLLLAS